jgi:intein/homing endonuclease
MPSNEKRDKSDLSGTLDKFLHEKRKHKTPDKDEYNPQFLNIIEFIDQFNLIPNGLYPVQKFILKIYYNIQLDTILPEKPSDRIRVSSTFRKKDVVDLTEVQYLRYLYDNGRCNIKEQDKKERHELILAIGRRSGKCVKGDTLVLTEKGIISIQELGDPAGPEWQDLNVTVAQEGRKHYSKSAKFYNDGVRDVKSITTYCGYNITGTDNHRIKVLGHDGVVTWKYLTDIQTGDFVAIHRNTDLWTQDYLSIQQFHEQCLIPPHLSRPQLNKEKFCEWLRLLDDPVTMSRAEVAKQLGMSIPELQKLLATLRAKFGIIFRKVLFNKRSGSTIEWLPTHIPFDKYKYCNRRNIQFPDILNERWGLLLGLLVGDGTWGRTSSIQITGGCEELREFVELLLDSEFDHHTIYRKKSRSSTCPKFPWSISIYSTAVRKLLRLLGYDSSKPSNKHVPWSIFKSPKSVVAAFLRGFFETDGGLEKSGSLISACTASTRLATEIQILLLNFGIISRIRQKWNKKYKRYYYCIHILGYESRKLFAEQIGFITDRKRKILIRGIEDGNNGHSDTEAIPFQKERLRKLIQSIPIACNNKSGSVPNRKRTWLKETCGNVAKPGSGENISYIRLHRVIQKAKEYFADPVLIAELETLQNNNYYFDPVVTIGQDKCRVYDLTVPNGESFVANGMTNHNSALAGLISAYETYKLLRRYCPQAYYGMLPGSEIRLFCIANDKDQASIVYGEMSSHVAQVDYFKSSMTHDTQVYMKFRTANDNEKFKDDARKATITSTFKSSVAKGLRGRGVICCILDEFAFFINDGKSSDEQVYKAMSPSLKQFSPKDANDRRIPIGPSDGRMICISSPGPKAGLFYKLYELALSNGIASSNMLMIQAPTWEVNPTIDPMEYEIEFAKDPNGFETEYGAQFSDRIRGWIENAHDLLDCCVADLRPLIRGNPREPFFAGLDFALVKDGTSISLTHINNGKIQLGYHEMWYAGRNWKEINPHLSTPLVPYALTLQDQSKLDLDEIINWLVIISKRFYIQRGLFDQWAGIIFEQKLHKAGLIQFDMKNFTTSDSSVMYQTAKMLMYSRQLALYDYPLPEIDNSLASIQIRHSPHIRELLELQATSGGKNILVVEAPDMLGKHDDFSDSLVRSAYLAAEYIRENPSALLMGDINTNVITRPVSVGYHQFQRNRSYLHGLPPKERRIPKYRRR